MSRKSEQEIGMISNIIKFDKVCLLFGGGDLFPILYFSFLKFAKTETHELFHSV